VSVDDIQLVGAFLVLSGFMLLQFRALHERRYPYLLMNFVGSGLLSFVAIHEALWGFLLLEGSWFLFSIYGLVGRLRVGGRETSSRAGDFNGGAGH